MKNLTQKRVRELLDYDESTGVFRWRVEGRGQELGTIAGKVDGNYHRIIRIDGKNYAAHRLACLWYYGAPVPKMIKHINGDTEDNRIDNLKGTAEM